MPPRQLTQALQLLLLDGLLPGPNIARERVSVAWDMWVQH
jgi:hypothetical protein